MPSTSWPMASPYPSVASTWWTAAMAASRPRARACARGAVVASPGGRRAAGPPGACGRQWPAVVARGRRAGRRGPRAPAAACRGVSRSSQAALGRRARGRRLAQPGQHGVVLGVDDRPLVVVTIVGAAVLAEGRGQRLVGGEDVQRLGRTRGSRRRTGPRCCEGIGPAARRTARWRAPACPAPTPRAPPSTGSRRYDGITSASQPAIASNLSWSEMKPR